MTSTKEKNRTFANACKLGFILVAVFLVIYLLSVVAGSSDFFSESAEKNALLNFEEDVSRTEELVAKHYENLYEIVERLSYSETKENVISVIGESVGSERFGDLRYFSKGQCYDVYGMPVDIQSMSGAEHIAQLSASKKQGCTPVYMDASTQLDCIAFFVPVRGSEYIDGFLSIIPARNVVSVGLAINEKASAIVIIDKGGQVFASNTADGFESTIGNNFYDFLEAFTHDKSQAQSVSGVVLKGEKTAASIEAAGVRYTLAMSPISGFDGNLMLVSFSESEGLIAPELTYVRHVINLLIIALIALFVGLIYAYLYHRRASEAINTAMLVDATLDCPNQEQFRRVAGDLVYSTRKKYSVASLSIRNFIYISEQLGKSAYNETLKALVKIIQSLTTREECFGYAGDGKFLLLMIHANQHSISDKIKLIETLINRDTILKEKNIKIRFAAGVYNVFSGHRRSVQEMIDCANTACGYAEDNIKSVYTLFTEEVRAEIAHNEKIEAMMESALANGDFRLFLQPKYDAKHDVIHSAEALVRWFDTSKGDYMFPADFIPLFETNGFIAKLDHFVYIEVLEYLSKAVERGEKVVPIAVNVSRVTASSEDFINFYVGNKKKYGIPDGFITLELTESFAMEDLEKISYIITALHNSGMRCSIDDFGSGYSSFNALKQISFDELKLDSIFMKRGLDVARDEKLLETIINLAKFMGMSVVQEGVETKEMFDKVVALGCDVIQGYYYARAISLEEFKIFINTNTSIKYKSLVK